MGMRIPSLMLRQLYTFGSLRNVAAGFSFSLKNRLTDVSLTRILGLTINGNDVPVGDVEVAMDGGLPVPANGFSTESPLVFPLKQIAHVTTRSLPLGSGTHNIRLSLEV